MNGQPSDLRWPLLYESHGQILTVEFGVVDQGNGGVALWCDSDNVSLIGTIPSEGRRTFPRGLVNGGHAIDIGIGGASDFDKALWSGRFLEGGTVGFYGVTEEPGSSPVAGERCLVPLFRKAWFVDVNAPASGSTSVVGQWLDVFLFEVSV